MRAKGVCITVLVILVLIDLIGGVFVFWGGNKTKKSVKNKEKSKQAERQSNTTAKNKKIKQTPAKPYRATLVMSKDGACDAAKVIAGPCFLTLRALRPVCHCQAVTWPSVRADMCIATTGETPMMVIGGCLR